MNKIYKTTVIFIIIDIIVITSLVLVFGPLSSKLMDSISNKKVLYGIYNYEDVWEYSVNIENSKIDEGSIIKTISNTTINDYEKEIITKDSDNEDYKIIKLKLDNQDAWLVVIYDPTDIHLIRSKKFDTGSSQETVKSMCSRYGDTICINGGKFVDYGTGSDTPVGYVIDDGELVWNNKGKTTVKKNIIGFTDKGELKLMYATGDEAIEAGVTEGLVFGPFLIINGEEQKLSNYAIGGYITASRVGIAQRDDGITMFLVTNGTHGNGVSIKTMIKTFKNYGSVMAANLDGGASSQLVINNKLINTPKNILGQVLTNGRSVVTGFGVKFD